ncbi:ACP S-malonyltransferase [Cycloclasticus sp.]|uniref:ACP S-malonyltransferase n=1 Tax=Cycloclasticus sp. TaxID=2024830 RepID=UPI000C0E3F46|nr:ACP S-malonyltransferase [Cycloclasticus sp.]PHR48427.1 MAG: [acyl-carrier-protein] S-malonyltransferase [Cycloclasticus sp.]
MSSNKIAIVFPGQGSQAVGMLGDLSAHYNQIKETFDEASQALGRDLWVLAQNGPVEELNQTQNTQPLILTASVAMWRVLQSTAEVAPSFMAGHSLGEYTALVCAGSLDFVDAVKLVEQRAMFMQQAVPEGEGAMAAILGLEVADLVNICNQAAEGETVSAVNFNAPGQVVIAGNTNAVNRAIELAKEQGAKRALPLPVSVPSHCALMAPAAEKLMAVMGGVRFSIPTISVIHNTDVAQHNDASDIKQALMKQLHTPVRWVETVEMLTDAGIDTIIECGPGKVLSGLNKRINKSLALYSLGDERSFNKTIEAL